MILLFWVKIELGKELNIFVRKELKLLVIIFFEICLR